MSWKPTHDELYASHQAFVRYVKAGKLSVDVPDRATAKLPRSSSWNPFKGTRTIVLEGMLGSPDYFLKAYEAGVDIVSSDGGVPQNPSDFPRWK